MTDFGDFDDDDAFDTEPADPEQVAIRLAKYLNDEDTARPTWDDMTYPERVITVAAVTRLIAWLRRQGSL